MLRSPEHDINCNLPCEFPDELKKLLMETPPWRPRPSREVAVMLGVSLQVLANWRVRGVGPAYLPRIRGKGNKTFYKASDILAWASTFTSSQIESWQVESDWLSARDLKVHGVCSQESTLWLIDQMDRQLPVA